MKLLKFKKNNPEVQYIAKPLKGSGGYNTNLLNNQSQLQLNCDEKLIVQEYIEGINLSSSVLASENEAENIVNSRLLTQHDFEKKQPVQICWKYPSPNRKINIGTCKKY